MVRGVKVIYKYLADNVVTYDTSNEAYLPLCMVVLSCGDDALLGADVSAEQLSCGAIQSLVALYGRVALAC